jgi:multiple sugar transport system substrate-binding protein
MKAHGTPGGMALGPRFGDGKLDLLVPVGARRQPCRQERQGHHQLAGDREGAQYAKQLYENFIPGTASWNDAFNNKAFLAGEVQWTNNGISIYAGRAARSNLKEIAEDMDLAFWPVGSGRQADRVPPLLSDAGDDLHQVSAGQ